MLVQKRREGFESTPSAAAVAVLPCGCEEMARHMALACCKMYVSDSRNLRAVERLQQSAAAHIIHTFTDTEYNRVGFTLAGALHQSSSLQSAVLEMVQVAMDFIDLTHHRGSHPRLGVVDHICLHPLGSASLEEVAALARSLAAEIGVQLRVPTFLYGAPHQQGRSLADLRRSLGYFRSGSRGLWEGSLPAPPTAVAPDFGPPISSAESGVLVVGACGWVTNYNVPLRCNHLKTAARIAAQVSERGGGLAQVQAMALLHGEGCIELACNLLNTKVTDAEAVQIRVAELATRSGIDVMPGYYTGYSEEQVLQLACDKLSRN